ncbi:hypothetical protein L596_015937 [Steinernema carpocapsae]|uniref:Fungal lipase-type domain-containing protein n=1 Tax=Steinernema carpocapsae TaxID=34508 RepID=A0A4U5NH38_STECR|nr:hypothetical protein L596_015937 [Steinernema carpocapsae]
MQVQAVLLVLFLVGSGYASPASYEEHFAVQLLNAAAAAYPDDKLVAETCLSKAFGNETGYQVLTAATATCGKKSGDICKAYIARSDVDKIFIIGIRGTEGIPQLWHETESGLGNGMYPVNVTSNTAVRVVDYFYTASGYVFNTLRIQPNLIGYGDYDVYVTGHSLGGALATLVAKRIVFSELRTQDKVKLVTFGEPRVGNLAFATEIRSTLDYMFRVVHGDDPIPHLPPCGDFASDLFDKNCKNEGWHQHAQEIWYWPQKKKMQLGTWKSCDPNNGEDPHCSDGESWGKRVMRDFFEGQGKVMHLNYFNHFISDYGKRGCVDGAATAAISFVLFAFMGVLAMVF